jgi:hypothetical protein
MPSFLMQEQLQDAARLLIHQFVDVSIKGVLHWVYPAVSFITSVTASFETVYGRK